MKEKMTNKDILKGATDEEIAALRELAKSFTREAKKNESLKLEEIEKLLKERPDIRDFMKAYKELSPRYQQKFMDVIKSFEEESDESKNNRF